MLCSSVTTPTLRCVSLQSREQPCITVNHTLYIHTHKCEHTDLGLVLPLVMFKLLLTPALCRGRWLVAWLPLAASLSAEKGSEVPKRLPCLCFREESTVSVAHILNRHTCQMMSIQMNTNTFDLSVFTDDSNVLMCILPLDLLSVTQRKRQQRE